MRALTRTLFLGAVAASFLAAPAADAAYCVGTTQIGTLCVTPQLGSRPSVTLDPHDDCVYVVVGPCVPVTYYTPGTVSSGGPRGVECSSTGVFAFSSAC